MRNKYAQLTKEEITIKLMIASGVLEFEKISWFKNSDFYWEETNSGYRFEYISKNKELKYTGEIENDILTITDFVHIVIGYRAFALLLWVIILTKERSGIKLIKIEAIGNHSSIKDNPDFFLLIKLGFLPTIEGSINLTSQYKDWKLETLFTEDIGLDAWEKIGIGTSLEFDLANSSLSMKQFMRKWRAHMYVLYTLLCN